MIRMTNLKFNIKQEVTLKTLEEVAAKKLRVDKSEIKNLRIFKKSLDARKKGDIKYVYSIDFSIKDEKKYSKVKDVCLIESKAEAKCIPIRKPQNRPIVVGSGPAGLMAGIVLAQAGLKPIIIEQGKSVHERKKDIEAFWEKGKLNVESNVQFGAGGAGTFSDGKLTTGVKNRRIPKVLDELIEAGAPAEIRYLQKPHIGTDILINVVDNLCMKITKLGGEILFSHKLVDIKICDDNIKEILVSHEGIETSFLCDDLILAIGHSARDTVLMLHNRNVEIKAKPFAVGVRIEHKQKCVNETQYGDNDLSELLGAADYKLNVHLDNGRGVYTFCMCPGGEVVASASELKRLVTNGMSYYKRDLENANSALLVSINPSDFGSENPLAGIEFQRKLEERAFVAGGCNYHAPVQLVGDFLCDRKSTSNKSVKPSYKPGVKYTDLKEVFDPFIIESLKEGIKELDKKFKGFANPDAVLTAVESRSSSPVTIVRDKDLLSSKVKNMYPCGEGAGYAGGIMSAAVDGIKCAEKIIEKYM